MNVSSKKFENFLNEYFHPYLKWTFLSNLQIFPRWLWHSILGHSQCYHRTCHTRNCNNFLLFNLYQTRFLLVFMYSSDKIINVQNAQLIIFVLIKKITFNERITLDCILFFHLSRYRFLYRNKTRYQILTKLIIDLHWLKIFY